MANKTLFKSLVGKLVPAADARNEHGAPAYALTPKQALAQYAATGCLTRTFYAKAEEQLSVVLGLCEKVEPEFVAKTAVYARERGLMKDMPALLLAVLAAKDVKLLARVFPRVVDNGKMLRNFVQIVRSGVAGRQSLAPGPQAPPRGRPRGRARRAVPDVDGARTRRGRVGGHRAPRAVADDAHEPQHVRAPRRLRPAGPGRTR